MFLLCRETLCGWGITAPQAPVLAEVRRGQWLRGDPEGKRVLRPAGQETTAIEKIIAAHSRQGEGAATPGRAAWGSTRVGQEPEGARGKCGQGPSLWFWRERHGMAG